MTKSLGKELAVKQDSVVANLEHARAALVEAKTISETKKIADIAAAAEIYAKRQQLGEEAVGIATSIKIEALRQIGQMLKATPRNEGQIRRGTKSEPRENMPTLKELGLDKKTSAVAQKLAELPEKAFNEVRAGNESISKAIAAVENKPKHSPVKQKVQESPKNAQEDDLGDDDTDMSPELQTREKLLLSSIQELSEEVQRLKDQLGVEGMDLSEGGKTDILAEITELRGQVKTQEKMIQALTKSRDALMIQNKELKNQVGMQQRKLKKVA